MKRFNTGNLVALGLAGLALAVAATGTAVAASSTVRIVDATTTSVAKVDSGGRLSTASALSTTTFSSLAGSGANSSYVGIQLFSKPTTAKLALTHITLGSYDAGSNFYVSLFRDNVPSTATSCAGSVTSYTRLSAYPVAYGDAVRDNFSEPVIVSPLSGQKFCLELDVFNAGSAYATLYYTLNAYVNAGTFTPNATPATMTPKQHAAAVGGSGR